MTVRDVATLVRAEPAGPPSILDREVTGASIDSRTIGPGEIFVPLPGERTDGHAFLDGVLARGLPAFCARRVAAGRPDLAGRPGLLVVEDPLSALTELARAIRARWRGVVVGVTGSNGKTTTKELTAAALGARYAVLKTEGNLNNHIGVPLTLVRLAPRHEAAIVEMGMNHAGEIRTLAALARPSIAIITNVSLAHAEGVGGLEDVLHAKLEIAEGLGRDDTLIVDGDDPRLSAAAARTRARVVRAGFAPDCDVAAVSWDPMGAGTSAVLDDGSRLTLALPGRHNVKNALLALAAARTAGVPRPAALEALAGVRAPGGRSRVLKAGTLTILDDTYNANPASMRAALSILERLPAARRIAVLGEMRELGPHAETEHAALGRVATLAHVDALVAIGPYADVTAREARAAGLGEAHGAPDAKAALALLGGLLASGDAVLVKGSRAARLEAIVEGLIAAWAPRAHGRPQPDPPALEGAAR